MQLVILHYHLNRGGVTSVVENQLRSLALLDPQDRPTRVAVVYGGRAAAWNRDLAQVLPFECSLISVPQLEYDHLSTREGQLYKSLQPLLDQFQRDSTVLHVHNHSLGKNVEMAAVLCRLADEGWRLLLQIHDFAEDLRPANYQHLLSQADSKEELQGQLYPQAAQIHYAVLNQRDRQVLATAGIAEERLHLLPNPVKPPSDLIDVQQVQAAKAELVRSLRLPAEHRIVLYPVRAIRRKNLGEILLWSLLVEDATFVVTLAPLNPQEQATYQRWVEFAAELQLPVQFDIASKTELSFEATYAASDAIITTSVAEGFGMVYLEASLVGRPLVGRRLPGVCQDFLAAGMQFPGLAATMSIPANASDFQAYQRSHLRLIEDLRTAYGLPNTDATELTAADPAFSGDTIDFGRLESTQQKSFLRRVKAEANLRSTLRELNPKVEMIRAVADTAPGDFDRTLANNRRVVAENYSLEVIGRQLSGIYQEVLASGLQSAACDPAIAVAILHRFVQPKQLFPIRLES